MFNEHNREHSYLRRTLKATYYAELIESNKYNMKKTWSVLNTLLNKQNDKSTLPQAFKIGDHQESDLSKISNGFNEFFSHIGSKTAKDVPRSPRNFKEYLGNPLYHSMYIEPVSEDTVVNTTLSLKSKTSSGHDEISTKLMKNAIHPIKVPLTHIINSSLSSGIFPDKMKIAKVVPVYKASDPTILNNYRPISLLPAFSKLLEKIMFNKIVSFLDRYKVLYKHQYGFRAKHSTIHPILHFLNHCAEHHNADRHTLTLATFCDLSKAFDIIDHNILLYKLQHLGLRGTVNNWISDYLRNRTQFVEFKSVKSGLNPIICGVPQGSILGPLLYLLYVNDIGMACEGKILSFADDTTLLTSNNSVQSLYHEATLNINRLYGWFCANRLSLNAKKTKYIVIRAPHIKYDLTDHDILIDGVKLTRVGMDCEETSTKFLGISIDETLSWKNHIANLNSKIARSIFSIKQLKNVLPQSCLQTLYFSLVHSHLTYGLLAWGSANASAINKTALLQKRAMRTVFNTAYNSHTEPLFKLAHIFKLTDLYEYEVITFMYDYSHLKLPVSFNGLFRLNHEVQDFHETRQRFGMYIARCHSTFSSKLPLYYFPRLWNEWSSTVLDHPTRGSFRKYVKATMLSKYQSIVKCDRQSCQQCNINKTTST